jgi:hypothetical protein
MSTVAKYVEPTPPAKTNFDPTFVAAGKYLQVRKQTLPPHSSDYFC